METLDTCVLDSMKLDCRAPKKEEIHRCNDYMILCPPVRKLFFAPPICAVDLRCSVVEWRVRSEHIDKIDCSSQNASVGAACGK